MHPGHRHINRVLRRVYLLILIAFEVRKQAGGMRLWAAMLVGGRRVPAVSSDGGGEGVFAFSASAPGLRSRG
jgi:hypothetical protein